jgi:hypothetical protein
MDFETDLQDSGLRRDHQEDGGQMQLKDIPESYNLGTIKERGMAAIEQNGHACIDIEHGQR